jgi:TetR/AcrR family transcriptional repressor of bet genes
VPKLGMEPFRRTQIREAAYRLIARNGFYGTTLRDVAAAAEVSKGTIHHYYDNKLSMLTDTLVYVSERNLARMERAASAVSGGEAKLRALIRASICVDAQEAKDAQAVWIWAMAESIGSEVVHAVVQERRGAFQSLILGTLRQFEGAERCRPATLDSLAAKLDAFLDGIETHKATGERRIDPALAELVLVQTVRDCLAASKVITRSA